MLEKIDNLKARAKLLITSREKEFLDSIRSQWVQRGRLSPGQINWYEAINQKYSKEHLLSEDHWRENWTNSHRQTATRVAYYYEANPPYYKNCLNTIFSDPDGFILSKREWDKFCENKYAKKIRNEYASTPKFTQGQCVQIRKANKVAVANYNSGLNNLRVANKVGFVLAVNAKPITRAAKGSRIYQVLLAGGPSPIFAHESDLKKVRKKNGK